MAAGEGSASAQELQWLAEFMAAQAAHLVQTSGAKAAQEFRRAMGAAAPDVRQAWLESAPAAADSAATAADHPSAADSVAADTGEDHETVATRIYSKAIDQLRADGVTLDDADLAGIWQHAWSEAGSCSPEGEQEAASRVARTVTIEDGGDDEEIDGEELYKVIQGFIEDIGPVAGNAS
jgi:hypothetical protein